MIIYTCPKCGTDLINIVLTCNPPINKKQCPSCGWSHEEKREVDIRIPYNPSIHDKSVSFNQPVITPAVNNVCDSCSTNIKNGGDGICHCTLGLPNITC